MAGAEGLNETASLKGLAITLQYPDGRLPRPGDWDFKKAVEFCAPLCFEPAEKHIHLLKKIHQMGLSYDDDPADLEALRGK